MENRKRGYFTLAPLFLDMVHRQSIQALRIIQGDSVESLLPEKQLALWIWANERGDTFSRKDAAAALGFPERTVEYSIHKLVDLKRLERLGQGKATYYKVLKES